MQGDSLYDPIPITEIRRAKARLTLQGLTVDQWAQKNGFHVANVRNVLGGRRRIVRGDGLRIAIALGLRPNPDDPQSEPSPPGAAGSSATSSPAVGALAGGRPVASCNRSPVSQLGEAAQ